MLELVRHRVTDEREVGLVGLDHVLEQRVMRFLPVQALLDVGLLADDARFQDREVACRRRRERLCHVLGEVAGEAGLARPAGPARVGASHRGVEQPNVRRVVGQLLHLDQHACGETRERPTDDRHLDIGQLALGQVGDLVGAVLAAREQHPVVVDNVVVGAVVDVGVEAVLVDAEVEHSHVRLQCRAVGGRHVRPAGGRCERDLVVLEAEGGDQRRPVRRRDIVGRHAAAGQECPEIDGGTGDGAITAACPLHLHDPLAATLCRLRDRLGDSTPGSKAPVRLAKGWLLMWNVLFVDPCTPGHAPVAIVYQPEPVFGGAWVSMPPPLAAAPLRRRSAKPGTPRSAA